MDKVEKAIHITLQVIAAAILGTVFIRLVAGCAVVGDAREEARPVIALVLKDAYALGGAEAVSNRIESLVVEGRITPAQAQNLHTFAQGVYERLIGRLEGTNGVEDASATAAADAE